MIHRSAIPALVALLGAAGCASSQFDRLFDAGNYAEAARVFESDPSLQGDERALFRVALAHAVPGSEVYRPAHARELLGRFLTLYPESSRRGEASRILALLQELERSERRAAERDEETRTLRGRIAELQDRIDWLEASLERQERQANLFREITERLEEDLRRAEEQIRALQEELARLKEIDLKRPTPPGTE
jgi:septal ring factor EnvC (AmiA/AmiB activator)